MRRKWFFLVALIWLSRPALWPQPAENQMAREHAYKSYEFSRAGDLAKAEQEMRVALELAPRNPLYHSGLGGILSREGKLGEARESFEKAIQLDPGATAIRSRLAAVTVELARSQARKGLADEAIRLLERATEIDPSNELACLELGALLADAHRHNAGLAIATAAAGRFSHSARAYQMLGFFQMKLQQNVAAAGSYARAVSLDAQSADASVELGIAQSAAGMTEEATRTFEAGIRRFPDHALHYQAYGVLLANLSESGQAPLSRAVEMLEVALRHDASLAESHYQLGSIALEKGDLDQAREHLERAAQQAASDSRVHFALSRLYRRLGRATDAAAELERHRVLRKEGEKPGV